LRGRLTAQTAAKRRSGFPADVLCALCGQSAARERRCGPPGLSRVTPGFRDGVLFGRSPRVEAMTETEANKKIVDEFTQGLFSEGDLERPTSI
jgi:hypothetical protein